LHTDKDFNESSQGTPGAKRRAYGFDMAQRTSFFQMIFEELRMAVRELGWALELRGLPGCGLPVGGHVNNKSFASGDSTKDSKQEVLDKWARATTQRKVVVH